MESKAEHKRKELFNTEILNKNILYIHSSKNPISAFVHETAMLLILYEIELNLAGIPVHFYSYESVNFGKTFRKSSTVLAQADCND